MPGGIHGGGFPKQKIRFMKEFVSDDEEANVSIILGNSQKNETWEQLRDLLNGKKIDFLFIDGDHRYEGVKSDFEMYKPFVKEGGLVAFHDIVETDYHHNLGCYVDKLWNEIKRSYQYKKFVQSPNQRKYGIGVLTV